MSDKPACENCRFWKHRPTMSLCIETQVGRCRRYPRSREEKGADDWCGEHQPAEGDAKTRPRCPTCHGRGTALHDESKYRRVPSTCPTCGGSGLKPTAPAAAQRLSNHALDLPRFCETDIRQRHHDARHKCPHCGREANSPDAIAHARYCPRRHEE